MNPLRMEFALLQEQLFAHGARLARLREELLALRTEGLRNQPQFINFESERTRSLPVPTELP